MTEEEVADLERDEAELIYRVKYWNALLCDQLPPGLDLAVFDFGVNAGIPRSAKILQTVLQVEVDGHVGPMTILAVKGCQVQTVIDDMRHLQDAFYQGRPGYPKYGHGWDTRTLDRRNAAVKMATNG